MASCSDPIPAVALVASFHQSPGQRRTADPLGAERWTTPHMMEGDGGCQACTSSHHLMRKSSVLVRDVEHQEESIQTGLTPSQSATLFSPSRLHFHGFRVGTCTDTNHYAYHCTRAHTLLNSRSVKTQQTSVV